MDPLPPTIAKSAPPIDGDSDSDGESQVASGIGAPVKDAHTTGGEADSTINRVLNYFMAKLLGPSSTSGSDRPQSVPMQKFEDLCKKYLKKKKDLRDQRNLIASLNARKDKLQDQIKLLDRKSQNDDFQIADLRQHVGELGRQCHETERARQAEEAEKKVLERKVLMLKRDLSASTRVGNQITDDEICQKMGKIFYLIHGFAASILRKGPLDIRQFGREAKDFLNTHVRLNLSAPLSRQCQLALIVCVCSDTLMRMQRAAHYFGLPPQGSDFRGAFNIARSENVHGGDLKAWLEPTRKLMSQANDSAVKRADQCLLDATFDIIKNGLGAAALVDWKAAEPLLRKALLTAHELFRSLHHSKASFHVEMYPVRRSGSRAIFDDSLMTAINSVEEEADLVGQPLAVCAFPAILKYGNELGENQDEMTVVCKAQVVPQEPRAAQGA
ncbi:hypothetical protein KC332_g16482 [Hortaea werneckii]|uniref:Uncharacterized protein n=2 Tax=Hortaea werneckii TaxID=91943 RepID=A0A3M7I794_HORWE|nr:hypothetical protein KC358_g3190 [Hortaea werneckii]OTA24528.1 hypothetical protein BTJ68_11287 [Hortaea werneckii EXF-2000]KAI6852176.1 hypothetical protein KC350_g1121 [Hortaea werneckii]KAI6926920.1 hypothetical protein KC348_g8529 [Hortaea werneckii]KAI6934541.1 hypothetical protein KC341_g7546 [Hortaea werneckii]